MTTAIAAAVDRVLRLVADGRLSAEEAGPILDALDPAAPGAESGDGRGAAGSRAGSSAGSRPGATGERGSARSIRIEIFERRKRVVNLRIPLSLGRFALARVPGLSAERIDEVEEAIAGGQTGPILDVEDDEGDGVRIVVE